jgi:hypothetical protein
LQLLGEPIELIYQNFPVPSFFGAREGTAGDSERAAGLPELHLHGELTPGLQHTQLVAYWLQRLICMTKYMC